VSPVPEHRSAITRPAAVEVPTCRACDHPDRDQIDHDLALDTHYVARYADRYGISARDVRRHRQHLNASARRIAQARRDKHEALVVARVERAVADAVRRGTRNT
jgi:hypothetical protein